MASQWGLLLNRALAGLRSLEASGITNRHWTFGGGTALMLRLAHRDSHDIDLFLTDAQLLGYLSPRLTGEAIWNTEDYDEATNVLKLRYPEGEIDFIVAGTISELPVEIFEFEGVQINIEHPAEIILKKMVYRDAGFKPRDLFDTAALLASDYADILRGQLHLVSKSKAALIERITSMPVGYFEAAMAELDILPGFEQMAVTARELVLDMVRSIPDQSASLCLSKE